MRWNRRGTFVAVFLRAACVVLATMLLIHYVRELPTQAHSYSVVLACTAVLVATIVSARGLQTPRTDGLMTHSYFHQLRGKVAVAAVNYIPLPTYRGIFPKDDFAAFARAARFLNARKWLHPAIWDQTFLTQATARRADSSYGLVEKATPSGDKVTLSGWAYLAEQQERPHAIIALSLRSGSAPRLLGITFPAGLRQDVFDRFRNFEALSTGWSLEVPASEAVDPLSRIVCFAYDANIGMAYQFPGTTSGGQGSALRIPTRAFGYGGRLVEKRMLIRQKKDSQ